MNGRLSLEQALGFLPSNHEKAHSLERVSLDGESLGRAMDHWASLPPESLPQLKGIAVSPGDDSRVFLNLMLDLGGSGPMLCLEADVPRDRVLPDFALAWPHAEWWQEELSRFHDIRFDRNGLEGGVQWRRA